MSYKNVLKNSLRDVLINIFKELKNNGLPSPHSFAISFSYHGNQAIIPSHICGDKNHIISIHLDHRTRYKNLEENGIGVETAQGYFYIPFSAITQFFDEQSQVGFAIDNADDEAQSFISCQESADQNEKIIDFFSIKPKI